MIVNFIIGIYKKKSTYTAHVAQSVERRLGKAEVVGSIPIVSSKNKKNTLGKVYQDLREELAKWQKQNSKEISHM